MSSRDLESLIEVCTSTLTSQIRNYTEDQLQLLLQDDQKINSFIGNLSQLSSISNDKEMKFAQSKSLAEYNLSIERKLTSALENLQQTHKNAVESKKSVEQMKNRLDELSNSRSLDSVCSTLRTLSHEAEKESEKITEDFHKGEIDVDDFLKKFSEKRALVHLRKIKAEKLAELLRQQQYKNSSTANVYPVNNSSGSLSVMFRTLFKKCQKDLNIFQLRGFPTLREKANVPRSEDLYEPRFEVKRHYPDLKLINVKLKESGQDYPLAHKCEKVKEYKPQSVTPETEYELKTYARVIRLGPISAIHLPLFVMFVQANTPVGVQIIIKEHEASDETERYIPDPQLEDFKETLRNLDDPVNIYFKFFLVFLNDF
ncbi:VPS37 C-terminal domain-containing protein [Meloidogyne graminicola]|uniref:VPS37 C-terminal domain-containing protein n=1 Tax=Meloidogyne graminicola TaxID=189291 RepID=A0A8S9ZHZ6_9BILA|nr:VPS37 C-terminal domain-containing protein [Meloidogyne graminicola]